MDGVLERLGNTGLVPVVVIEDVANAVPTANALIAGGIDVMEITLRTKAGLDSIMAVAKSCPDMLVGAGTVITLDQTKQCADAGAKFIVSPGFNRSQVEWCLEKGLVVIPGCVTPTEIIEAMELGLNVLKFFPAKVYGGLEAIKSLAGPFGNVKFIPTGGVNAQNLGEFAASPFVHSAGGSWVCSKADIAAGNIEKITTLCAEAMWNLMGFEFAHVGINTIDADAAMMITDELGAAFGFEAKPGNSSNFAGDSFEIIKGKYLGDNGHIAIRTNNISRAIVYLKKRGYEVNSDSAKYKGEKMVAIYLKDQIGGFAVHLLQK